MPSRIAAAFEKSAMFSLDWRLFIAPEDEQLYVLWQSTPPSHPAVVAAADALRLPPAAAHSAVLEFLRHQRLDRLCSDPYVLSIARAVLRASAAGGRLSTFLPTRLPPEVLLVAWRALPRIHPIVCHLADQTRTPRAAVYDQVLHRLRVYAGASPAVPA